MIPVCKYISIISPNYRNRTGKKIAKIRLSEERNLTGKKKKKKRKEKITKKISAFRRTKHM
jgi:hypothetical protein